jgi:hypothetical protein
MVTYLTLPLATAQSLELGALRDSQSLRCLMIAIKNKQEQINI